MNCGKELLGALAFCALGCGGSAVVQSDGGGTASVPNVVVGADATTRYEYALHHMSRPLSSFLIGQALRTRRERAGLTPARVARECGVSVAVLGAIESGRTEPSVAVLGRVARALGVSLVGLVRAAGAKQADGAPTPKLGLPDIARAVTELPARVGSKMDAVISAAVLRAMKECGDNQSAASRLLGMERKAFVRRLQRARRK